MAITPISTRTGTNQPRKDGRKRGASQKDDHTMIRLEDKSNAYIGMLDCHNPYVAAVSALLEKSGFLVFDNIEYQSSKDQTESGPQKLVLK